MNEALLGVFVKSLGVKPETVNGLIIALTKSGQHVEDIKSLLADNLEVNKQILETLKKGGNK
jgi:hypothetical protein